MVKKLMLAVAMVALLAAPSFAAVQNVKVGGDLTTTSVIRNGFDLGLASSAATNNRAQNVILSQVNLNVDADLTDNVSTKIGLKNERLWGDYTKTDTTDQGVMGVKLETANVTLKEFLYSPLSLTIGRQPLVYGNQMIVGAFRQNNTLAQVTDLTGDSNYDAIKAVLAYDALTVDLLSSRITEGKLTSSALDTNVNLYGINANYKLGDKMSTVVEGYMFVKATATKSTTNAKRDTIYVPGLRVSTNPIEGLNVQLEGAYETGTTGLAATSLGKSKLTAYALQGMVNYALPVVKDMKPVVSAGVKYLSGEKAADSGAAADDKISAWQPIYGNQFVGTIWNTLFAQSNLLVTNLGVELTPIKDLTTKLTWSSINQAQRATPLTLTQPDGAATTTITGKNSSKKLGNEVDLDVTYAYTEDVKLGLSAGVFFPGQGLAGTVANGSARDAASQLLTSVSVAF